MMTAPLKITFRELSRSTALEARIQDHLMRLERFHPPILHCHVILDASVPLSNASTLDITIELKVPGCEICVHRAPTPAHEDIYVALRDAFDAAKRLLRDHARVCECSPSHISSPQSIEAQHTSAIDLPRPHSVLAANTR